MPVKSPSRSSLSTIGTLLMDSYAAELVAAPVANASRHAWPTSLIRRVPVRAGGSASSGLRSSVWPGGSRRKCGTPAMFVLPSLARQKMQ